MKKKKRKLKKKRNPYPIWKIIVFNAEYIICRLREVEPTGWRVIYHVTDLGTSSWKDISKLAYKALDDIVVEEGGSADGVYFEHELIAHFRDQLRETGTKPVMINEEEVCFETVLATRIMRTIVKCAHQRRRATVLYKKSTGKVVKRDIAPYSMKDDYLYVTDTRDGNTKIKSLKIYNIRSAKRSLHKYKPQWDIEL